MVADQEVRGCGWKGAECFKVTAGFQSFVGCVKGIGSGQLLLFTPLYPTDKVVLFLVLEMWGHCKEQGVVM